MARKRVRLEYIENDTARRVTYKKRVKGLVKKTQELSVLCDVDACAVVYGPYDKSPVVWPSSEAEARRILMEFKRKPEMDQSQRRFNQLSFLKQSVAKSQDRLAKLQRRNRELQIENLMVDILNGRVGLEQVSGSDLADLMWVIDDKCRSIQHRMQVLSQRNEEPQNVGGNDGVMVGNYHGGGEVGNEEMLRMMMMMGGDHGHHYGSQYHHHHHHQHGMMHGMHGNGWYYGGSSSMN